MADEITYDPFIKQNKVLYRGKKMSLDAMVEDCKNEAQANGVCPHEFNTELLSNLINHLVNNYKVKQSKVLEFIPYSDDFFFDQNYD